MRAPTRILNAWKPELGGRVYVQTAHTATGRALVEELCPHFESRLAAGQWIRARDRDAIMDSLREAFQRGRPGLSVRELVRTVPLPRVRLRAALRHLKAHALVDEFTTHAGSIAHWPTWRVCAGERSRLIAERCQSQEMP